MSLFESIFPALARRRAARAALRTEVERARRELAERIDEYVATVASNEAIYAEVSRRAASQRLAPIRVPSIPDAPPPEPSKP
jgi:uridine kinase